MKKMVMVIVALVCVAGVCFGTFMTVKNMYEVKIDELTRNYEREIQEIKDDFESEISERDADISVLYDAIWNMHTYEDYMVTIRHDGEVHTIGREWIAKGIYSRTWDLNWSN